MLRLVDKTLSCLDGYTYSKDEILSIVDLLKSCDVTKIELSKKMYAALEGYTDDCFILCIEHPNEMANYPEIKQFVCSKGDDTQKNLFAEYRIKGVQDYRLSLQSKDAPARVTGLGNLFQGDVENQINYLKNVLPKKIEFCPTNEYHCATGAAVAWVHYGLGNTLVTTVGGIGGFAAFEEVLIALRHLFRRKPSAVYENLPLLREVISRKTGWRWGRCAPVVGEDVFVVESGIHICGILKHPKCYEAFPPESVGLTRKFVYGKFSGRQGVAQKLEELGYSVEMDTLDVITKAIKDFSQEKGRSLTEDEFFFIAQGLA